MHHSVNSRSVMLFGQADKVEDSAKLENLRRFVDGLFPGRNDTLRADHAQDLKATMVLEMEIVDGSAKSIPEIPATWRKIIPYQSGRT